MSDRLLKETLDQVTNLKVECQIESSSREYEIVQEVNDENDNCSINVGDQTTRVGRICYAYLS